MGLNDRFKVVQLSGKGLGVVKKALGSVFGWKPFGYIKPMKAKLLKASRSFS